MLISRNGNNMLIYLLYGLLVFSITAFDQFFKFWVVSNISLGGHRDFIPGLISLTNVHNTGAAFSMLENQLWLLLVITFIAIAAIIAYMVKAKLSSFARISLSMILGGAIGNAIDRVFNGYVVDMFDLDFMNYAIFNVADCFIVIGGIMFCVYFIRESYREKNLPSDHRRKIVQADGAVRTDAQIDEDGMNAATGTGGGQLSHEHSDASRRRHTRKHSQHRSNRTGHDNSAQSDSFMTDLSFNSDAEFHMDPETLAFFDPDYPENTSGSATKSNRGHGEGSRNNNNVIQMSGYDTPSKPRRSSHTRDSAPKSAGGSSSQRKSQSRRPVQGSSSGAGSVNSGESSDVDLSFTQRLDLEFDRIFNNNKDGNDKNQSK